MMYASKIIVNYKPQKIKYHREVELPERLLNLEDISKHLKEGEQFGIREVETGHFGNTLFMDIFGYRLETSEELTKRIAKEEDYNRRYENHISKFPRNKKT